MIDDLEQLQKVQTQLNSAISIALKKRHEIMLKLPEKEKQNILQFEKDYRKLMKSGDTVEASNLHMKMIEKHRK